MFTVLNTKDTSFLVLRHLDYFSLQNFFLVWFIPKERRDYLRKLLIVDTIFFHEWVGNEIVKKLLPKQKDFVYWRPQFYENEVVRDIYQTCPDSSKWTPLQRAYMDERDRMNKIKTYYKEELLRTVSLNNLQKALTDAINTFKQPSSDDAGLTRRRIFNFWFKKASVNQSILLNRLLMEKENGTTALMETANHKPNKRQRVYL